MFTNGETVFASIREGHIHRGPGDNADMGDLVLPPDIADSTLLAVITNPLRREVVLKFGIGERRFELRAEGVEHMLVNEFLHQNIVDELRDLRRDPHLVTQRLATLLFDCQEATEVKDPRLIVKLDSTTAAVVEGRKVLLELIPAYGASVLLLAQSARWLDLGSAAREDVAL